MSQSLEMVALVASLEDAEYCATVINALAFRDVESNGAPDRNEFFEMLVYGIPPMSEWSAERVATEIEKEANGNSATLEQTVQGLLADYAGCDE